MFEDLTENYLLIGGLIAIVVIIISSYWYYNRRNAMNNTDNMNYCDEEHLNDLSDNNDPMYNVEPSDKQNENSPVCEGGVCEMPNELNKADSMKRTNIPYLDLDNDMIAMEQMPKEGELPVYP
jgi:FtsZ-interacting cell division protein ZipA